MKYFLLFFPKEKVFNNFSKENVTEKVNYCFTTGEGARLWQKMLRISSFAVAQVRPLFN